MSRRNIAVAQKLRKRMTVAEQTLWRHLRAFQLHQHKFRRQHPLGPYVLDFVCLEAHLVIEVDGGQHADNPVDAVRDQWLQQHGYCVLRFWNSDLMSNIDGVLARIDQVIGGSGDERYWW